MDHDGKPFLRAAWPWTRTRFRIIATLAALLHAPAVAYAQGAQTAEFEPNGVEVALADCAVGVAASRDWLVVPDTTASSGAAIEHVPTASTEATEALAICRSAALKNGHFSLRFKPLSGASDQGGGLALRMASLEDYYLVKIDALRDRALILIIKNGVAEEIVGVDADVAADAWHTLAVQMQDDRFTVYLDGTWIFTGYDKTFSHEGRMALWAEPRSITRFDRITTEPIPKPLSWR